MARLLEGTGNACRALLIALLAIPLAMAGVAIAVRLARDFPVLLYVCCIVLVAYYLLTAASLLYALVARDRTRFSFFLYSLLLLPAFLLSNDLALHLIALWQMPVSIPAVEMLRALHGATRPVTDFLGELPSTVAGSPLALPRFEPGDLLPPGVWPQGPMFRWASNAAWGIVLSIAGGAVFAWIWRKNSRKA